jgi:hypothetical protein
MNKLIRLGRSIPPGQLRIGVVVQNAKTEIWKIELIEELLGEPAIKVAALFTISTLTSTPPPLYARSLGGSLNAGPERLVEFPNHFPAPTKLGPEDGTRLGPDEKRAIAGCDLDVLIWLTNVPNPSYSESARFGVWWFSLGDPCKQAWRPAFFAEAARGDVVTELWLLASHRNSHSIVLERYSTSTQQGWNIAENAVQPLKAAPSLLLRRLLDLLEFGPKHFAQKISRSEIVRCESLPHIYPHNGEIGLYLARQIIQSIKFRLEDRGRRLHWFIAARSEVQSLTATADRFVPLRWREIPTSAGSQEADPFVITWNGRAFLFYEEIPSSTGRGCISCREIGPDLGMSEPVRVIEQPYHMSYPFLLPVGNEIYLLPETSENRTLELYRATKFPFEWTLDRVLLRDVALVDTTPFLCDGIWYFFTSLAETGETLLFYADRFDGEWHYHPMNPICTDVRRSRSAGALFYRQGKLMRPAQDCSVRYGYALALNEITVLSRTEYSEKLVETILPDWGDGLLGTHTLNAADSIEVIDGLRMR